MTMGNYNHNNPTNKMRARRLLASIMEEARKEADKGGFETGHASHLFENMARYLDEDKLDGIHIYPAPLGGWHTDLSFKDMPTGTPPVVGTPKAHPCKSREEAVDTAVQMLAAIIGDIRNKDDQDANGERTAAFEIDSVTLYVPVDMLDEIRSAAGPTGLPADDYVRSRLDETRKKFGGKRGIDADVMESLTHEQKMELHVVAAMALLAGFIRWPESMDMAPEPSVRH